MTHADSGTILNLILEKLRSPPKEDQGEHILAALMYINRLRASVELKISKLEKLDVFAGVFSAAQNQLNTPDPAIQENELGRMVHYKIREVPKTNTGDDIRATTKDDAHS